MPRQTTRSRALRVAGASVLAALLLGSLAACSTPSATTLRVLSGEATVDGEPVGSDRVVVEGDVIATSGDDAIAELEWSDGSFTRLATGSRFTVGDGQERGTLDEGTVWSAVAPDASEYTIATDEGSVAGDPGASFALRCVSGCDGAAAVGAVTLDDGVRIEAPATFTLGDASGGTPAGWDTVFGDAFALANAGRDEAMGLPSPAQAWADADPALASMSGTFEGRSGGLVQECTGWAEECARVQANVFANEDETFFEFTADCSTRPCAVAAVFNVDDSAGASDRITAPLVFDGNGYALDYTFGEDAYCYFPDGSSEGRWVNGIRASFVPVAAAVQGGAFVVTQLESQVHNELVLAEATTDPSCTEFEYQWSSDRTADLALQERSAPSPAEALAAFGVDSPSAPTGAGLTRPSVLSDLRTPAESIPTLGQLAIIGAAILVLVLVLGYPAFLLSRVVSDRYEAAVARRDGQRKRMLAGIRWLLIVLGILVASVITAALDPGFGAPLAGIVSDPGSAGSALQAFLGDAGTARLVLTALASFVIFLGLGALVVRLVGRRVAPGVAMPLQFRWGSLLILLAGVVVSRVLELNPGIIFGLVAGLIIADSIPLAARGKLMLATALFAIAVGALAWTGYAILSPLAAAEPSDVVVVSSSELLSALTIEAVSALPLAFLPVSGLDGFVLRRWRFFAWALVYALGVALFAIVLLAVPGSFTEIQGDAIRWLIGFGAFTIVAIVIWLIHRALTRRAETRTGADDPA